ncbi:Hypothetical_protein [Hexamita inflata]|uniref:Hypothetical_protein n=1 Tax=Hexamita inflata TaxID=28002 RepID=A0AA86NSF2_9EUKA|nr:Hypothetical protein HINF_LOCUS211 [Hexamita inflata]CAI9924722.1 Hypothetical protein HINF_LOCUS12367 [Hexamita inflata]
MQPIVEHYCSQLTNLPEQQLMLSITIFTVLVNHFLFKLVFSKKKELQKLRKLTRSLKSCSAEQSELTKTKIASKSVEFELNSKQYIKNSIWSMVKIIFLGLLTFVQITLIKKLCHIQVHELVATVNLFFILVEIKREINVRNKISDLLNQ